jgi:hypothetical protein
MRKEPEGLGKELLSSFPIQLEPEVKVDVPFGDLLKSEFSTFNTAAQLYKSAQEDLYRFSEVDAEFTPGEQPEWEQYKPFADSFADVYNRPQFERKMKKIDSELEYYKLSNEATVLENIGSSLLNGVIDPINWVGVGEAKAIYTLGKREAIREGVKRGAIVAGGTQAASEAILQSTMETRSAADSAIAITAATLLGSVLGGAAGYLKKPLNETAIGMEKDLDAIESIRGGGSVGAAQVYKNAPTTIEQETMRSAFGLEKAFGAKGVPVLSSVTRSPTLSLLNSTSLNSRRIAQELAEIPNALKKFDEGIAAPTAVESLIRQHQVNVLDIMRDTENLFKKYRNAGGVKIAAQDVAGFLTKDKAKPLTEVQFREEIGKALIGGTKHEIPEVQQAAQNIRNKIFDKYRVEATEVGLLPDDLSPEFIDDYMHRVWDREAILAERPQFEKLVFDDFKEKQAKVLEYNAVVSDNLEKARALKTKLENELADVQSGIKDITPEAAKNREKLQRKEVRIKIEMARLKDAEKTFKDFSEMADSKKVASVDVRIKDMISAWKGGSKVKMPKTLTQFLRSEGGILSSDIDLTTTIKEGKNLVRKDGKSLDELGLRAFEDGYFPERPTVSELVDALTEDLAGRRVFSIADAQDVVDAEIRSEAAKDLDKMFMEMNISNDMSAEQIAKIIAENEGKNLKVATGVNKAKYAQASFYEKYAKRRLESIDKKVTKLKEESDLLASQKDELKSSLSVKKEMVEKNKSLLNKTNERISRMNRMLDESSAFRSADDTELKTMTSEVTENVLGMSLGNTGIKMPHLTRGPLKERTWHIPNSKVARYIEKDAFAVVKKYIGTIAPDIEMTRVFGRADLRDQIEQVGLDYSKLIEEAGKRGASEKEIRKITEMQKMDLEHITGIRDRLNGSYARPSNEWGIRGRTIATNIKLYNVITSLGGVALASLPDIPASLAVHGITRTFKGSMKNFGKRLKGLPRPSKREAELAGLVGEAYTHNRASSISDVFDPYSTGSKLERGLSYGARKTLSLGGFNIYVDTIREIIAATSIERSMDIIKNIAKGAAVPDKEIRRLAMFGLDKDDAVEIWKEFQKHGGMVGKEYAVNSEKWDNVALARKWSAALGKEVLKGNIQPGQEKPLFMSGPLGSVLFQFKSFVAAANQRILIAGLQERDAAFLQSVFGMVAAGMLVAYLRLEEDKQPEDFAGWVREGVDRSGLFGWAMEANNIVEKVTGNNVGLSAAMGTKPPSRFSSRGSTGAVFGVTAGKIDDALKLTSSIASGDFSEGDAGRIRRNLFLQNNWYLKGLFDELEEGLKEALVN